MVILSTNSHNVNRSSPRRLAALVVAALIGGCALPGEHRPAPATALPAQFVAADATANDAAIDDRWWSRFGDARLTSMVDAAVRDSPVVGQALAQRDQARAQAGVAGADRLPQVSAGLDGARARQRGSATPGATPGASTAVGNSFGLALDVRWELDLWQRLGALDAAARADALASEQNLRAVRQSIAARTARSYFGLVAAQRQAALSARVLDSFAEVARQVGDRADVGVASPSDKLLASANVASSRAGLAQRREAVKRQATQLDLLRRRYPAGDAAVADALPALPPPPPAGLPAELLQRRPDVQAAEARLRASGLRLDAAQRALLPRISLTGSVGSASSELGDLLDGGFGVWTLAGQLLQPIFQGGRLRAQAQLADARQAEAAEAYAEVVLQALAEVETALAVEAELRNSEDASAASAEAAERAVEVSLNRYRAGIDPLLNVLESERRWLDGRSAQIAARLARIENRIHLHLALGGGFETATSSKESEP